MKAMRMKAMRYRGDGAGLVLEDLETPTPGPGEVRIRIRACGVCRTDLHLVDDELSGGTRPITPGHEIVGTIDALGAGVDRFALGQRVGVPWLAGVCGTCVDCLAGRENLCADARFTGHDRDGGYAEATVADARFVFPIPDMYSDEEAAPLLCAGLIGFRTLRMAGDAERIGLYGFGAAAHITAQVAQAEGRSVYAFTRPGDTRGQAFARSLGVDWAGGSDEAPPMNLDAALLFAPVGELVPIALSTVRKGGRVVCGGIHMSDIPSFPYSRLWGERSIHSVANLTRRDAEDFLRLAPQIPIRCKTRAYALDEANAALADLRDGRMQGAAVLLP
jgi:propanol-preferring alcohol dehydrogenase